MQVIRNIDIKYKIINKWFLEWFGIVHQNIEREFGVIFLCVFSQCNVAEDCIVWCSVRILLLFFTSSVIGLNCGCGLTVCSGCNLCYYLSWVQPPATEKEKSLARKLCCDTTIVTCDHLWFTICPRGVIFGPNICIWWPSDVPSSHHRQTAITPSMEDCQTYFAEEVAEITLKNIIDKWLEESLFPLYFMLWSYIVFLDFTINLQ